jgi:hypothetical protein
MKTKHLRPTSLVKEDIKKQLLQEWATDWTNQQHGRVTHRLEPKPTKRVLDKHFGLERALSSILTQMRTGKISLKHYLWKIGAAESDRCGCGADSSQTVYHVLFECELYIDLRLAIWAEGHTKSWPSDLALVLGEAKFAKLAAKFMYKTELLQQFRAVRL